MSFLDDTDLRKPLTFDEPLPRCEGPKLHPYKYQHFDIEFLELIRDNKESGSSGGHAHVFKVRIDAQLYVLKIFKFFDARDEWNILYQDEQELISIHLLHAHSDYFFNECRAFGRIIDAGLNGKIAVRCHGYLTLPAEKEDELRDRFNVEAWDRASDEYDDPVSKRQPLRAILKDFLEDDVGFTRGLLNKILRDLKSMHKIGVYIMDVESRNYKAGLVIDMSVAMTEPHYEFFIRPEWQVEFSKEEDFRNFRSLKKEVQIVKAPPNEEYCAKLRPRKKATSPGLDDQDAPTSVSKKRKELRTQPGKAQSAKTQKSTIEPARARVSEGGHSTTAVSKAKKGRPRKKA